VSWGIEFQPYVFLNGVEKASLVGTVNELVLEGDHVGVAGQWFAVPGYDDMEHFVATLEASGLLAADSAVSLSRTGALRRRAVRAAGLSPKQLGQLERARTAHRLIQQRVPLAQAAVEAGYCSKAPMS
jgi:hypothetical protein